MARASPAEKPRRECDTSLIDCQTTQGLTPLKEIIGQERAVRALGFGIGIKDRGFDLGRTPWVAVRRHANHVRLMKSEFHRIIRSQTCQ